MAKNTDINELIQKIDKLVTAIEKNTATSGELSDKIAGYKRVEAEEASESWKDRWTGGNTSKKEQYRLNREAAEKNLENLRSTEAYNYKEKDFKGKDGPAKKAAHEAALKEKERIDKDIAKAKKGEAAAKGAATAAIADKVAGTLNQVIDTIYVVAQNHIKKENVRIDSAHEMEMRNIQNWGKAMTTVTKAQADFITGDVLDSAYGALNSTMEMNKSSMIKQMQDNLTIAKQNAEIKKINMDNVNAIQQGAVGVVSGIVGMLGPWGAVAASAMSVLSNAAKNEIEREKALIDQEMKLMELAQKQSEEQINQIYSSIEPLVNASKQIASNFYKMQTQTFQFSRSLMLSSENLQSYDKAMFQVNVGLSEIGMNLDDYYKLQSSYNESAGGRSNIIGTTEAQGIGALSKVLGVSPDEVASINGSMNVFNTSIEDGNDLIYSMSKNAARMGLNTTKYAKDLQKNLKLAEKYQFKDGVKGVMRMSAWAQKMRVDMSSMVSSMEKLHSGNIEDTIQTSAKLNVLGGNAALMSDPMSMLYNAYADPEQYAKNVANMVSGFGHFNKKTGMTEFNINEQMRMEAMASALGMSKEDFFNMARQQDKEKQIKRSFGNKFGEKTDFVTQNATWSKDKQDWVVKVKDGKGGFSEVGLGDLKGENDERLKEIFPEDKQDQIIDIINDIRNLLSPEEAQKRAKQKTEANTYAEAYGNLTETGYAMADRQEDFASIHENIKNYAKAVEATQEAAVKAQELMMEQVKDGQGVELLVSVLNGNAKGAKDFYEKMFTENGIVKKIIQESKTWQEAVAEYNKEQQELLKIGAQAGEEEMTNKGWEKTSGKDKYDKDKLRPEYVKSMNRKRGYEVTMEQLENWYGTMDEYVSRMQKANPNYTKKQAEEHYEFLKQYHENALKNGNQYVDYEGDLIYTGTGQGMYGHVLNSNKNKIQKTNDLIISPKHGIWRTDPEDTIVASKPGGSLDRAAQQNAGTPSNINLTVTGTLTLSSGNQKIDLMELIRNNPDALRELTQSIIVQGSKNVYGGKGQVLPHRFTFGN